MQKIKVIDKGYTLTVTSWENDGDHYNLKSKTVATREEAKVWWRMMQLCRSKNNPTKGTIGLGNTYGGFDKRQTAVAAAFIEEHREILQIDPEAVESDDLACLFCELAGELLGYAEDYACRVMSQCRVIYSPEEVSLEEVTF